MRGHLVRLLVLSLFILAMRTSGAEPSRLVFPSSEVRHLEIDAGSSQTLIRATMSADAALAVHKDKKTWGDACRIESTFDGDTWYVKVRSDCIAQLEFEVSPNTSVRYTAGSGDVSIVDIAGKIEVNSKSGEADVRTASRDVAITTGSGAIRLVLAAAKEKAGMPVVHLNTDSGDVRIEAKKSLRGAALHVGTNIGHTSIELPRGARVAMSNHGEPPDENEETFLVDACSEGLDLKVLAG